MRRLVLALLAAAAASSFVLACSDDPSSGGAGSADGTGAEDEETEIEDDEEEVDASRTRDAGRDAARDTGRDGATSPPKDAGIDASPLACPPEGAPTTACANGVSTTFAVEALPALHYAESIDLKIDKGGFHHAAWASQSTTPGIGYMTNRSGAFVTEAVAAPKGLPSEALRFARLAIDACGRPTVLYMRRHLPAGSKKFELHVFVASRVTGGWVEEELKVPTSPSDATPATDFDTADLTMDGSGEPIVLTRRYTSSSPVLSRRGASGWTHEATGIYTSGINLPRVVWSSTFGPVLAYANSGSYKPTIAFDSGAEWTALEIPGATAIDSFAGNDDAVVAVSADSGGAIHVAYVNYVTNKRVMRYARIASAAGGWSAPVQVPLPFAGLPLPMRVLTHPGLEPRIVFQQFNGAQNHQYVATMSGGTFSAAKDLGTYSGNGAAIDENGRIHVFTNKYDASNVRRTWHLTQGCAP